ncbi:MAG: DUF4230 domain-containing protein [Eubacteriales bacterium]|jgi:hypothetical protein
MSRFSSLTAAKKLAMAAILIAVTGVGCFLSGVWFSGRNGSQPVITSDLLGQQLRQVSQLVTVEYHYTNMGRFENHADFYGWKVPFTKKSFILSYDGKMLAGVDLEQAEIEVGKDAVTITLPPAQILSHEMDQDSLQVFDESKNIFNPLTLTDFHQFTLDQTQVIEQKAIDDGLLEEAGEKAQTALTTLLTPLLSDPEHPYTLTFHTAKE